MGTGTLAILPNVSLRFMSKHSITMHKWFWCVNDSCTFTTFFLSTIKTKSTVRVFAVELREDLQFPFAGGGVDFLAAEDFHGDFALRGGVDALDNSAENTFANYRGYLVISYRIASQNFQVPILIVPRISRIYPIMRKNTGVVGEGGVFEGFVFFPVFAFSFDHSEVALSAVDFFFGVEALRARRYRELNGLLYIARSLGAILLGVYSGYWLS